MKGVYFRLVLTKKNISSKPYSHASCQVRRLKILQMFSLNELDNI